jgi:hypothetical protein
MIENNRLAPVHAAKTASFSIFTIGRKHIRHTYIEGSVDLDNLRKARFLSVRIKVLIDCYAE